eukprot:1097124-Pleurochrysis_carterae.AAC.1
MRASTPTHGTPKPAPTTTPLACTHRTCSRTKALGCAGVLSANPCEGNFPLEIREQNRGSYKIG